MEPAAKLLKDACGVEYRVIEGLCGLQDTDRLMTILSEVSGRPMHRRYDRQRRVLVDGMRDAHVFYGTKRFVSPWNRTWRCRCRGGWTRWAPGWSSQ